MILTRKQAVEFDPGNKEHRDAVHYFLKNKSWGPNAPKFAHDHTNNMAHFVQEKLLMWYLDKDASKPARRRPAPKKIHREIHDEEHGMPPHFLRKVSG